MTESNTKNQKETNSISVPIYFNERLPSKQNLLIGKIQLPGPKNLYKMTAAPTSVSGVKEYTITKENDEKLQYKGTENKQDSNYVLLKYNSKDNEIHMYPANRWVSFFKSIKSKNNEAEPKDHEKKMKEELKRRNEIYKDLFNFNGQQGATDKPKKGRAKKKGLLDNFKEEEDIFKPVKQKEVTEFKEDSHSSENSLDLADDSYSEDEKIKKELTEKKKKEKEKEKVKEPEKNENEEDEESPDDDDDKDDNEIPDDDSQFFKQLDSFSNMIGKKRDRESSPNFEMEEIMENILRKKSRMTYQEILEELKKECKTEDIDKYFEDILDRITDTFQESNGETYYYLKK